MTILAQVYSGHDTADVLIPCLEILAEAPYHGKGTGDTVYAALFADTEATAKYDSVYDRTPREVDDGEGGVITVTPPAKFCVMA